MARTSPAALAEEIYGRKLLDRLVAELLLGAGADVVGDVDLHDRLLARARVVLTTPDDGALGATVDDAGELGSLAFASGWGGEGVRLHRRTLDDGSKRWAMELDELTVRGRLSVFEIVARRLAALGGTYLVAPYVTVAEAEDLGDGTFRVAVTDDVAEVTVGSFLIAQEVDWSLVNAPGDPSVGLQDFVTVWRAEVLDRPEVAPGEAPWALNELRLSMIEGPAPRPTSVFVRYDHATEPDERYQIVLSASGAGEPTVRFLVTDGSGTWPQAGSEPLRLGRLSGRVGFPAGAFGMVAGPSGGAEMAVYPEAGSGTDRRGGVEWLVGGEVTGYVRSDGYRLGDDTSYVYFDAVQKELAISLGGASLQTTLATLSGQITTVAADLSAFEGAVALDLSAIDASVAGLTATSSDHESRITAIATTVGQHGTAISALQLSSSDLDGRVTANATLIAGLDVNFDGLSDALAALDLRVTANDGEITANASLIATVQSDLGTATAGLQAQVTANDTDITSAFTLINQVETAAATARAGLSSRITSNTTGLSSQFDLINEVETSAATARAGLQSQITANVNGLSSQLSLINTVSGDLDLAEADIFALGEDVGDLYNEIGNTNVSVAGLLTSVDTMSARVVLVAAADGSVAAIELKSGAAGGNIRFKADQVVFDSDVHVTGSLTGSLFAGTLFVDEATGVMVKQDGLRSVVIGGVEGSLDPLNCTYGRGPQFTSVSRKYTDLGTGTGDVTSYWDGVLAGNRKVRATVNVTVSGGGYVDVTVGSYTHPRIFASGTYQVEDTAHTGEVPVRLRTYAPAPASGSALAFAEVAGVVEYPTSDLRMIVNTEQVMSQDVNGHPVGFDRRGANDESHLYGKNHVLVSMEEATYGGYEAKMKWYPNYGTAGVGKVRFEIYNASGTNVANRWLDLGPLPTTA